MRALEVSNHEILNEPLDLELIQILREVSEKLSFYGVTARVSSAKSLEKLKETPTSKKQQICSYFKNYLQWIDPVGTETYPDEIDFNLERIFIQRALKHYNLYVDEEFMLRLEKDMIVEIYGADMVQIYRSISFFDVCGYSLLDLSLFEWYTLWERPTLIKEKIAACIQHVTTEQVPIRKFDVPRHILRETYDTGLTSPFIPRTSVAEFVDISSVMTGPRGKPIGFACTARGYVLNEGDDALAIDFV